MEKKVIFTVKVNHSIDIITNSSSELFVLEGQTKEIVDSLLKSVHPDYLDEYAAPVNITEISNEMLSRFLRYITGPDRYPAKISDYQIPKGFTFEELYEPDNKGPAWNGAIQYKLKNNEPGKWFGNFVTDGNREWFLDRFNPERNMYFVYSHDENPDYENQQKLWQVSERYHLG